MVINRPIEAPLSNRTEPPAPGSTRPFGQRELDAIRNGPGVWVWSATLEAWLFWVRNEKCRLEAMTKGIDARQIWSLRELTGTQGLPPEWLHKLVPLKELGMIVLGPKPARWRDVFAPFEPAVTEEAEVQL